MGSHLHREIQHPSDKNWTTKAGTVKYSSRGGSILRGGSREEIDPDLDLDVILSNSKIISFKAFQLLCNQRQNSFLRSNQYIQYAIYII